MVSVYVRVLRLDQLALLDDGAQMPDVMALATAVAKQVGHRPPQHCVEAGKRSGLMTNA